MACNFKKENHEGIIIPVLLNFGEKLKDTSIQDIIKKIKDENALYINFSEANQDLVQSIEEIARELNLELNENSISTFTEESSKVITPVKTTDIKSESDPAKPGSSDSYTLSQQLREGSEARIVNTNAEIRTNADVLDKFKTSTTLYDRYVSKLGKDLFRIAFIDFDKGRITLTNTELNDKMDDYKQKLFLDIQKYLKVVPTKSLYTQRGAFNLKDYENIINAFASEIDDSEETTKKLEEINATINNLNTEQAAFLNAYNAYITLTNLDSIIGLYYNDLLQLQKPEYKHIINVPKGTAKYAIKIENKLDQHFRINEDSSIDKETTALTKAIINNIPRLNINGTWDGHSYLEVNEVNTLFTFLQKPEVLLKYESLRKSLLHPEDSYLKFFKSLNDKTKLILESLGMNKQQLEVLESIKSAIFDTKGKKSLYSIMVKYQFNSPLNYFSDLMAYFNKQSPSNYTSYSYDADTKSFVVKSLSQNAFEKAKSLREGSINIYCNRAASAISDASTYIGKMFSGENKSGTTIKLNKEQTYNNVTYHTISSVTINNTTYSKSNAKALATSVNFPQVLEDLSVITGITFTEANFQEALNNRYSKDISEWKTQACYMYFDLLNKINIVNSAKNVYGRHISDKNFNINTLRDSIVEILKKEKLLPEDKTGDKISSSKYFVPKTDKLLTMNSYKGGKYPLFIEIVYAYNAIENKANPSNVKDTNKNSLPAVGLINLTKTFLTHVEVYKESAKDSQTKNKQYATVGSENIFFKSNLDENPFRGITYKSEFVTSDGTAIPKNKFNTGEYFSTSFALDYLYNLTSSSKTVSFLPTVYADKSTQSLIQIDKSVKFIDNKNIQTATAEDIENAYKTKQKKYYNAVCNNIILDYKTLIEHANASGADIKVNSSVFNSDITNNITNWINEINRILSIPGNFDKLVQASKTANVRFINETHYSKLILPNSNGKAVPQFNPFIANMWAMFNESTKNKIKDIPHIPYNEFQKANIERFCKHLSTTNVQIDTLLFPFITKKLSSPKEWISQDKYLILYKHDDKGNIILNPLLEKFFYLDGFISTQFMQMTGGEPYTHPSKMRDVFDANNPIEYLKKDHAKRLVAQYKRMVIQQATFHPLMQNTRTGVPDTYNIANYEDRKGRFITLTGGTYNQDVLDGSAECPGWINIWENNSLMSSSAGENKKNISHNLDPVTGAPLLLKYALFAINNNRIRSSINSTYDRKVMLKKGSLRWAPNVILGKDFLGKNISLSDVFDTRLFYYDVNAGAHYEITGLEYSHTENDENIYNITYQQVKIADNTLVKVDKSFIKKVSINSNYDLWQALGGEFSEELIGNTIKQDLDWSENSMKAVAAYGNVTGFLRCKETNKYLPTKYQSDLNFEDIVKGKLIEDGNGYTVQNGEYQVLLTQSHVYLPLKHSDIHYHAQISSTKCGASNTNTAETLALNNDETINFFEVKMPYNGIQMDADHYADRGEVTEATQVISTLAANGKTSDIAEQVYNTIGVIVKATLNDYLKGIQSSGIINYKGDIDSSINSYKDKTAFTKALGKAVINLFTNDSSKQTILQGYLNKAAKQLDNEFAKIFKEYNIPYSANAIYGKFLTNFTSRMNSDCIKRKMSGLADIMIPSHGAVQFYNITLDNKESIKGLLGNSINLDSLVGRVSYLKILTTLAPHIKTKGCIENEYGERLFGKEAVDYILNKISLTNRINTDDVEFYDTVEYDTGEIVYIDDYDKLEKVRNQHSSIIRQVKPKDLLPFDATFEVEVLSNGVRYTRKYSIYDLQSTKNIFNVTSNKNSTREAFLKAKKELDEVLTNLENGKILASELVDNYNWESTDIVKVTNLIKKPAQVVLSNVYARTYGLKKGDNISDILNNPNFFKNRLSTLYDNATKVDPNSDFILISADGNNAYVRCITSDKDTNTITEGLQEVYVDTEQDDDGNTWRIDSNGNKLYKVDGIKFYVDSNSREYIILDYDAPVNIVDKIEAIKKADDFMDVVYNPLDIDADDFHTNTAIIEKYIDKYDKSILNSFGETIEGFNLELISKPTLKDKIKSLKARQIKIRGNQMWNSFKETLKVTANRIPAQTFQSIMTMEVVGFSESDANEVYVSAIQLILQGSDYDIDKAYTMVTPVDRNGIMRGWSPIFDCTSPENLEASKKLPFPNYDITNIEVIDSFDDDGVDVFEVDSSIINKANYPKDYDVLENGTIRLKSKSLQLELAAYILNAIEKNKNDTSDGNLIYDLNNIKILNKVFLGDSDIPSTIDLDPVINLIKKHLEKPSSNRTLISMAKAFNYNSIYTISNSLKNAVASQSPIEIRAPKEVAKKSTLGKYGETVSNFDPMVKYNFFFENMAGKDVIGIMAVAQKIFLATSQMLNMKVKKLQKIYEDKGKEAVLEELRKSRIINNNNFLYKYFIDENENLRIDKIKASTVANINWDEASKIYDIIKKQVEGNDGINEQVSEKIKANIDTFFTVFPEDISLLISELLSAATDSK